MFILTENKIISCILTNKYLLYYYNYISIFAYKGRKMPDKYSMEIFEMQAAICKTLSQPRRLMIIHELREGGKSVGQLAETLEMSQPNVSQHLAVLKKQGVVDARRDGTSIIYTLSSPRIGQACDLVRGLLAEQLAKDTELAGSLRDSA